MDERVEKLPDAIDSDIIAFSVETYTAKRAHILAGKYRTDHNIIVMDYYHFYFDLSQSEGVEIIRVSNVYYPIFQTVHNAKMIPARETKLIQSDLLDIGGVLNFLADEEFQKAKNEVEKIIEKELAIHILMDQNLNEIQDLDKFEEINTDMSILFEAMLLTGIRPEEACRLEVESTRP